MQSLKQDKLAMCLSGLCIIHCIAAPIVALLAASGLILSAFTSEWVHIVLFVPMLLLICSTVMKSAVRHQYRTPLKFAAVGMLILAGSFAFHGLMESILGVTGGALVFVGHLLNARFLRQHCRLATGSMEAPK